MSARRARYVRLAGAVGIPLLLDEFILLRLVVTAEGRSWWSVPVHIAAILLNLSAAWAVLSKSSKRRRLIWLAVVMAANLVWAFVAATNADHQAFYVE